MPVPVHSSGTQKPPRHCSVGSQVASLLQAKRQAPSTQSVAGVPPQAALVSQPAVQRPASQVPSVAAQSASAVQSGVARQMVPTQEASVGHWRLLLHSTVRQAPSRQTSSRAHSVEAVQPVGTTMPSQASPCPSASASAWSALATVGQLSLLSAIPSVSASVTTTASSAQLPALQE